VWLLVLTVSPAGATDWEFVLLWQQLIDGGVAAVAAGDLKRDASPEIVVATWQNDIRVLSCSGERDRAFSAPPLRGNVTLLAVGRGANENFVAAATLWRPFVAAYASDGRRLWQYEDLKGMGVACICTVRVGKTDHVAAAYTGKPGIRLLDEHGGIVSTVREHPAAFFVAGLDVDDDGHEEVLSTPGKLLAPPNTGMAYYDTAGRPIKSIPFPGYTSLVVTADIDNDGKKDIVSYYGSETMVLGVWNRFGKALWTAKLGKMSAPSELLAADFDGDGKKEVVAAFPMGQIMVFKDGRRMAAAQCQQRNSRIAAADVDADGRAELLVGDGKGLRAFKLEPKESGK